MANDIPDHYWKNLLAITTRAQADDPTPENERQIPKTLDDESRKWLEEVMRGLVNETDPVRQLQYVLNSLHQYASSMENISEEDTDKVLELADRLDDLLSISDLSKQFINNGGLLILETFIMQSKYDELRSSFAQIILTWAENNEEAQNAIIDCTLFMEMYNLLDMHESLSPVILSSVLSAISGCIRSNALAFEKFQSANGPQKLLQLVKTTKHSQIAAKGARIMTSISYTMQDKPEHAKQMTMPIIDAYSHLVSLGRNFVELEYIREFILNYVEWTDVDESTRSSLLSTFDLETRRRDLDATNMELLRKLQHKFAPLCTG